MKTLRWGILSTAKIGREKVIPGIGRSKTGRVMAIASRELGAAQKVAKDFGIARAYGTYEELLADPEIDAIYNPLPNHLHVPWTLKAARAGKHVLCEKPIAMSTEEAEALLSVPKSIVVIEAFMVRHHPQWRRVRELIRAGALGELRVVQAFFSYMNRDPKNVRNQADIGGGGLLDIGCYPIVIGRYLFEAEPARVVALVDRDPDFKIDRLASALVDFGAGRRLDFTVATQLVPFQRVQALGTKARCEVVVPYSPSHDAAAIIRMHDGSDHRNEAGRAETVAAADQYAEQADAFARVVGGEPNPYGADDAVKNMRVLDALLASEKSGGWVTL
jgi:predicted dehydrogenase